MRLLVDQLWSPDLPKQLRDSGHDVASVHEQAELINSPDDEVWSAARDDRRAIFTENVPDYLALAERDISQGTDFWGLVLTTNKSYPRGHGRTLGRVVRALDRFLSDRSKDDACLNQVEWLPKVD